MPRSRTIAFTAEGTASKAYASPQTKRNAVGPMGCGAGRGRGRRRILSSPAARMALGHAHGRGSAPCTDDALATEARYSSMSLLASVLPAPESPLTMIDWLRRVRTIARYATSAIA